MAYLSDNEEARFVSREMREREAQLCERYRPLAIGAVAAAQCIRSRKSGSVAQEMPAILNCERDSD